MSVDNHNTVRQMLRVCAGDRERSGWKAIPQGGSVGNHRMGQSSHIHICTLSCVFNSELSLLALLG